MTNHQPATNNHQPATNNHQPAVQFENVSKTYSKLKQGTFKEFLPALVRNKETKRTFQALSQITWELEKGESLGILGKNGSGKSTILKLIAGVTKPSDGRITVNGKVAPLIELGAGFHPELTGRENVYLNGSILGIKRKQMDKLYKDIVEFAELEDFMDEPIKHYSSGMYMRLAFAVAVAETPDILLVDEILAVGDVKFQNKCLRRMHEFLKQGATMIMVSHNLDQLEEYCQKGLLLHKSKQIYYGDMKEALTLYKKNYLQ